MTQTVDWALAERVAVRVAGEEPFAASYHYDSLAPDFQELAAQAERLVGEATGLWSAAGPARARVTDRPAWIRANIASFQRLLRPLTDRLGQRLHGGSAAAVTRKLTALEVGALLGWMSTRVLGQYDLLIIEDEDPHEQDLVYFVGPNVLALEKRFSFPPREFRLWLALHEVTHRVQFTGIPWLREHFLSLVEESLQAVDPDPRRLLESVKELTRPGRHGSSPLDDGGLVGLLASPEQREVLGRIGGLMSLLEGHGDVTMDRAGADRIPSAERFSRVLRERRRTGSAPVRLLQKLIGLEAKLAQYEAGERFIAVVEAAGGTELLDEAWTGPEMLPTLAEIREPQRWIERVEPARRARAS